MPDTVKPRPDQPAGVSSALVTGAEIARLAGVTRAAVSNWRRRYEDFPPAVGGSASSPLFVWDAVQKWLDGRDKSQEVSLEVQTWQALRAAYGDATGAAVAAAVEYLAGDAAPVAADASTGPVGPRCANRPVFPSGACWTGSPRMPALRAPSKPSWPG